MSIDLTTGRNLLWCVSVTEKLLFAPHHTLCCLLEWKCIHRFPFQIRVTAARWYFKAKWNAYSGRSHLPNISRSLADKTFTVSYIPEWNANRWGIRGKCWLFNWLSRSSGIEWIRQTVGQSASQSFCHSAIPSMVVSEWVNKSINFDKFTIQS